MLYKWNWNDLDGNSGMKGDPWGGETNSRTVFLRPTTDAIYEAIKSNNFSSIGIDVYPSKWPRENFPYISQVPPAVLGKARL